jgi:sugar/nucleoside kinase (ribokinase family)
MSEAKGRILVVGDVMTDVIVVPEGPLVRGSDRRASIRSRPGGSGANQAVWLGSMGTRVSFVARVGAADKPHLEAYFKGFHVDPILVADALLPSGVLVTIVDRTASAAF